MSMVLSSQIFSTVLTVLELRNRSIMSNQCLILGDLITENFRCVLRL